MFNEDPFDPLPERRCRKCGCTDLDCRQCIKKTGRPCYWVDDDLCSACVQEPESMDPGLDQPGNNVDAYLHDFQRYQQQSPTEGA